jgi:neutral ceramidase
MRSVLPVLLVLCACGDDGPTTPDSAVSTELCNYVPVTGTARAGGTVTAGALMAGAAENMLDVPVGTALGGYTGRAGFISSAGSVDTRKVKTSGTFNPSIGVESAPRVKALALTAGGETVVIIKLDAIFAYEGMLFDLEQRLGEDFAGKVIIATSHSHSAWAQFTGHGPLKLGSGQLRDVVYKRFLDACETTARAALAARVPAKLGVFSTTAFDPTNQINRDRRGDNDMLPGGDKKDDHMFLLRVDSTAGAPIAIVPIFGQHPTLNGEDNPFASSDAVGALERTLNEQFDAPVVVMHLQSAGADVSAVGHGGVDCNVHPGKPSDPCFSWTGEEGHGRAAVDELMAAWTSAGTAMKDSIELEMLTRSVETGPFPENYSIRDGALTYAPFDINRLPDGVVSEGGALASPIDEYNAPVGAALCEKPEPMFPAAAIPGTEGILPYGSCLRLDVAGGILGPIFNINFGVDETHPVCETTRTTVSALRIGDYVLGTMPGELSVLLAGRVRQLSPIPDKTIVVGYAQGHIGYMLRPEDWVLGGYEPSVTFGGPLEAELVAEKLAQLLPLAMTPMREDGTTDGTTRVATATITDDLDKDEPAQMRGTVPATVPALVYARTGTPAQAQPAATIARVSGVATFTWIGDDPLTKTPRVTLQKETAGVYANVTRRSGRPVEDMEIVLAYSPSPLQRSGPQTHFWVAEWQAVPWVGMTGLDTLNDRGGLPLGNYRFHVEGAGWMLDSTPFAVVPGGVILAQPTRTGGTVRTVTSWYAPKGWRLMDMSVSSNTPVPVRSQQITVELLTAGDVALSSQQVTTDSSGVAQVADNVAAMKVRVTDRFGNSATSTLP